MTNHLPNDLSHLSDAEFNSLCPQGEHAPGPEPLSPAAQAVLDATCYDMPNRVLAAAALRAAANHLSFLLPFEDSGRVDVADLLAIANELEGIPN
jgi:hypothetical protein